MSAHAERGLLSFSKRGQGEYCRGERRSPWAKALRPYKPSKSLFYERGILMAWLLPPSTDTGQAEGDFRAVRLALDGQAHTTAP